MRLHRVPIPVVEVSWSQEDDVEQAAFSLALRLVEPT